MDDGIRGLRDIVISDSDRGEGLRNGKDRIGYDDDVGVIKLMFFEVDLVILDWGWDLTSVNVDEHKGQTMMRD